MWCWRRLLKIPWTARISNHSILKEISSEYSLEGLMLKLKLQYFGHLMWRTNSLGKTLMLGKDWRWEKGTTEDEMVGWHHWLDGHEFKWALGVHDGQGSLACCSPWGPKELDRTERHNWTELTIHTVVWPSTPPISRIFSPFQTEILYSLKNNFTFSPVPLAPGS